MTCVIESALLRLNLGSSLTAEKDLVGTGGYLEGMERPWS
jgi:hypothetical protein